jgi:hypothetical protein
MKVLDFFNFSNPSSRTNGPGVYPASNMNKCLKVFPGNKAEPACKANNLTATCEPTVLKMWEPRRLSTLLAYTAYYRDTFTFCYFN